MVGLSKFVCSRFYKWSRIALWIAAVIIGGSTGLVVTTPLFAVALGYTIIPVLIKLTHDWVSYFSREHPARAKIEEYIEASPMIAYLKTLFEDVKQFNEVNKDCGVQFHIAEIDLVVGGTHIDRHTHELYRSSLKLRTTPIDDRNIAIRLYKDIIASWYPGSCPKSKEELESDFSDHFHYDKDGYVAKNEAFQRELQKVSVDDFELWSHDDINSYILELRSFSGVSKLYDIVVASKAIETCFQNVTCRRIGTDKYHDRAYGYYYHIVIDIPSYL